jgi:hypothetical protein
MTVKVATKCPVQRSLPCLFVASSCEDRCSLVWMCERYLAETMGPRAPDRRRDHSDHRVRDLAPTIYGRLS